MTREQFLQLPGNKQYLVMINLAVQIALRNNEAGGRYYLFQLNAFYVEIAVNDGGTITGISSMEANEIPVEYTDQIDISSILEIE